MTTTTIRPAMHGMTAGLRLLGAMNDAPAPPPAPAPAPEPPSCCDIDFSKIDTPEKAALLPALNPTAIVAVAAGIAASMSANSTAPVAVAFMLGANTPANLTCTLAPGGQIPSLDVTGKLGAADFHESWKVDEQAQALHIDGQIGESAEQLTVTADPRAQIAHVDGKIGDVEVHQTLSLVGDGDNRFLRADGSLGAVAFRQEIRPDMSDPKNPKLEVTGMLGDKPIQSTISASQVDNQTMAIHGEGTIAGNAIKVDSQVQGRF
jgi:hypothetical protein